MTWCTRSPNPVESYHVENVHPISKQAHNVVSCPNAAVFTLIHLDAMVLTNDIALTMIRS